MIRNSYELLLSLFSLIEWKPEDHKEKIVGPFSFKTRPSMNLWRGCSWKLACVFPWWMAHKSVSFWAVYARIFSLFLNINELKAFSGKEFNHLPISLCYILVAICMGVAAMPISWGSKTRLYWRWENNKTQYPTNQFKRLSLLAQNSNLVQMIAFLIGKFLQHHSPSL